jgi:hypothetical protein
MSTFVVVNTYTYAVTYVTDKLLTSIKTIVRLSGLSPDRLTTQWTVLERGVTTWLRTQDLEQLHLEVYHPTTDQLVGRWDFQIFYGFQGDGAFGWIRTRSSTTFRNKVFGQAAVSTGSSRPPSTVDLTCRVGRARRCVPRMDS